LPYRKHPEYLFEFLGRYEICPAHSDEVELCSITGGYDNSDKFTIEQCALNELMEEAGYEGKLEDLVYLGSVRGSKSSDGITHLFAIDIDKCTPCEAVSDGTLGEVGAYCDWINLIELINAKDPLLLAMYARLTVLMSIENVDLKEASIKIN
jgi:8-oxo-dGTP pyrophosphatase MutT (NUDIX family)